MPTLFEFLGYKIYFWSDEGNEPVHVHVSKRQSANATKIVLPTDSNPVVVHNKSRIPKKDLTRILRAIALERNHIVAEWHGRKNQEEKN